MREVPDDLLGQHLADHVLLGARVAGVKGMTAIVGAQVVDSTPVSITGRGPGGPTRYARTGCARCLR